MSPQLQGSFPPGAAAVGGIGPQVSRVLLHLVCTGRTPSSSSGLGQQPRDDIKKLCRDSQGRIETINTKTTTKSHITVDIYTDSYDLKHLYLSLFRYLLVKTAGDEILLLFLWH